MNNIRAIALTPAQVSAIHCSGILDDDDDCTADDMIFKLSVIGTNLIVSPNTREAIARAGNDMSNAEDVFARHLGTKEPAAFLAARASKALTNLFVKVSRLTFEEAS